jgi:hypothetical protein
MKRRLAVLCILLVIVAIPLTRYLAMWWYGHDFNQTALNAAKRVAGSSEYCIFNEDSGMLVESFADLDEEKIINRAISSSLLSWIFATHWRQHHFRIIFGGETYWWSFSLERFVPVDRVGWELRERLESICLAFRGDSMSYQAAYWEKEGLTVAEQNFAA